MIFGYLNSLLEDPRGMLIFFLLALPGRLLAISAHEFAHAWVADRCGDPTARMLGRLTLNPMKHLDPLGVVMMLLLGIGWAKPVPVNPRNYRNYRRDDLLVSLAGITMNLILFLLGFVASALMVFMLLRGDPYYRPQAAEAVRYAASYNYDFIGAIAGNRLVGYLYEMLGNFVVVNISLAIFNLLPVPPLDGYHVLNDMVLRRDLFASRQAANTAMVVLYVLMFTGILGSFLSYAVNAAMSGVGWVMQQFFSLLI